MSDPPPVATITTVDDVLKVRRALQSQLNRIVTALNKHHKKEAELGTGALRVHHEDIIRIHAETIALEKQISRMVDDDDYPPHEEVFTGMYEKITTHKGYLKTNAPIVSTGQPSSSSHTRVKLPQLELPTFSGSYSDWSSYQDLFTAIIHDNKDLTPAQKMQYLKSSLKGEAAGIIQSMKVTDDNYGEAWSSLRKRYENKREIVYSYMKKLFGQPYLTQESASAIKHLSDTSNECIRALKVLGVPVKEWDTVLVFLVTERLDPESRRRWALTLKDTSLPTYKALGEFIEQHVRGLLASETGKQKVKSQKQTKNNGSSSKSKETSSYAASTKRPCDVCKDHPVYKCAVFLAADVPARTEMVKQHSLCNNCLQSGHNVNQCKYRFTCKTCNNKHSSLLHPMGKEEPATSSTGDSKATLHVNKPATSNVQVLMSTAVVKVRDNSGALQPCRVLIDSASEASFITENCLKTLGFKRQHENISVTGISGSVVGSVGGKCDLELFSRFNTSSVSVTTLVLPKITGQIPAAQCAHKDWKHIKGLQLADPHYYTPNKIDILLGADIYSQVMTGGKISGPIGSPSAFNTVFGWVLTGKTGTDNIGTNIHVGTNPDGGTNMDGGTNIVSACANIRSHHCSTDELLQKFWEVEHLPERKLLTAEEKECEEFFAHNHIREPNGRYTVRLPFKHNTIENNSLGVSREIAVRRLNQVDRRLQKNPDQGKQYQSFMQEYLDLDHMELIPPTEIYKPVGTFYYLPHHHVMKEDSSTTKLRVVFDASSKSSSGISLNECQMVGPKLQDDLLPLLLRFRLHIVAFTADIAKMYRQILVDKRDIDYQRILWKDEVSGKIQDYRLKTVTYGTASAPYLAVKCLQQLAKDDGSDYPLAAQIILHDFYVDDLMSGAQTIDEAIVLQSQLVNLCAKGGFELRKWSSNAPAILDTLPSELKETKTSLDIQEDSSVKTLGVKWTPDSDTFSVQPQLYDRVLTKRIMLSELAKVFDPVGWLSPVTITAKIIMQQLWQLSLDWDDNVPYDINLKWLEYRDQLQLIQTIQVPRCITTPTTVHREIHGFCDASEHAYSAVTYMRNIQSDGTVVVRIIAAKTKVAPIKQQSLPRLELCGAVLLCKLLTIVQTSLKIDCDIFGWTDSTTVLRWLAKHPRRWNTFVANRVSEVQDLLPSEKWRHVKSEDNPADCASRGISAVQLIDHNLWWSGPAWLSDLQLPPPQTLPAVDFVEDERKQCVLVHQTSLDTSFMDNYSSLNKLKRVTAYVLRFIINCCRKSTPKLPTASTPHVDQRDVVDRRGNRMNTTREPICLTPSECAEALDVWIFLVQQVEFSNELSLIKNKKPLHPKSPLYSLNPFVDKIGLLSVGGRLQHSNIPENKKHPIILPRHGKLTQLIIDHFHSSNMHAGPQLLWASIQQQFWIIRGRDAIRHFVSQCVVCKRQRAQLSEQLMGSLPSARVTPGPPFQHCGVDYAGPITLKVLKGRGQKTFKGYIALFVCMATKAVHLEAVSDLTTEAFIAALKRFVSRRGKPTKMFSDCGTNFVGASKELIQLLRSSHHNSQTASHLLKEGIQWNLNPPSSPHNGGLWEAGVKSVKFHLRRVVGQASLNFEDLTTVLAQIESCLNSRPLCAISTNPDDLEVLTPGHFLIGQPLNAIPEPDITSIKLNRLSRWQRVQQLTQHFWRRWTTEYLPNLQQRFKWVMKRTNFQVGDLVLIKEDNVPPLKWIRGRVTALHPGTDQCVRVVSVKTQTGIMKRPIVKLCPLLPSDENSATPTPHVDQRGVVEKK